MRHIYNWLMFTVINSLSLKFIHLFAQFLIKCTCYLTLLKSEYPSNFFEDQVTRQAIRHACLFEITSYVYNNNQERMNDSINSADQNFKRPKSLFHEINTINTEDWKQDDFLFSPNGSFHQSFDRSQKDVSFINDLPLQSKITETILQAQTAFELDNQLPIQQRETSAKQGNKSNEIAPSLSSNSNFPSQVTVTLHEESLASKILQEYQTDDDSNFSTSLKSFLKLNDKNYRPHLACMKFLYQKLKEHSKQSLDSLRLYMNFLQIKIKQQVKPLRAFDKTPSKIQQQQIQVEDDINMDQKVLIDQMRHEDITRRAKRKQFYSQIKEIHEQLLSIWRKIKQKREKKERVIQQEIIRTIDRIELEMQDMIKCRLMNERQKTQNRFTSQKVRSQNPYLTKDKYLQMKYLIQRQNAYLKLITDLNGKIITYMVTMFSKEEIQIHKHIKEAMVDYATAYMNCYDSNNQLLNIKINNAEEEDIESNLKNQFVDLLSSFIPKQLYDMASNHHKVKNSVDKLQTILCDFSHSLQNTIFLSTIQMNNQFIIFRNEASWKNASSFFQKQQNFIDYQSKQALANSKSHNNVNSIQTQHKDIKVVVVLTSNYYLHLENEDKVATVKLGDVKLSKRGREIIIFNKNKGIGAYFGVKTELGRLQFQTNDEVDIFASQLSLALGRIAYS